MSKFEVPEEHDDWGSPIVEVKKEEPVEKHTETLTIEATGEDTMWFVRPFGGPIDNDFQIQWKKASEAADAWKTYDGSTITGGVIFNDYDTAGTYVGTGYLRSSTTDTPLFFESASNTSEPPQVDRNGKTAPSYIGMFNKFGNKK